MDLGSTNTDFLGRRKYLKPKTWRTQTHCLWYILAEGQLNLTSLTHNDPWPLWELQTQKGQGTPFWGSRVWNKKNRNIYTWKTGKKGLHGDRGVGGVYGGGRWPGAKTVCWDCWWPERRGQLWTGEKLPATHSPAVPASFRTPAGARALPATLKTTRAHTHYVLIWTSVYTVFCTVMLSMRPQRSLTNCVWCHALWLLCVL